MELMFIVWFVGIVDKLPYLLHMCIAAIVVLSILGFIWSTEGKTHDEDKERRGYVKKNFFLWKTCIALAIFSTIIPSESTMKYMAGAYLIQSVYESEFVNKAAPLAEKAILNQLSVWAEEEPAVKALLEQAKTVEGAK